MAKLSKGTFATLFLIFSPFVAYAAAELEEVQKCTQTPEAQQRFTEAILKRDLKALRESLVEADPNFGFKGRLKPNTFVEYLEWFGRVEPELARSYLHIFTGLAGMVGVACIFPPSAALALVAFYVNAGNCCWRLYKEDNLKKSNWVRRLLGPRQSAKDLTPLLLIADSFVHSTVQWENEQDVIDAARALIDAKADINARDPLGNTAIMYLALARTSKNQQPGVEKLIDLFLRCDADLTPENEYGFKAKRSRLIDERCTNMVKTLVHDLIGECSTIVMGYTEKI